jgi:hypothetical protein
MVLLCRAAALLDVGARCGVGALVWLIAEQQPRSHRALTVSCNSINVICPSLEASQAALSSCCGPIRSAGEYGTLGARQISIDLARVERQWSGARRCSFRRF